MSTSTSETLSARGVMRVPSRASYPIDSSPECVEPCDRFTLSAAVHATSQNTFAASESTAEQAEQSFRPDVVAASKDNAESVKAWDLRATVMALNKREDLSHADKARMIQKIFHSSRGVVAGQGRRFSTSTQAGMKVGPERDDRACVVVGCKLHGMGVGEVSDEEETSCCRVRSEGRFPGFGAPACKHYERKCWLLAACCKRYYPCRRCHDEVEDHSIDRFATEYVGCTVCGAAEQAVAKSCGSCGTEFAAYFCSVCRFFDDGKDKEIYHCDKCGICRVGKGVGIDNHHCDRCNSCVPLEVAKSHPCIERSLEGNCPICSEYLASSVEQVVFMRCGHAMHATCFTKHTATRYTCPICSKSLTDMSAWYRTLDERLAAERLPAEYAQKRSHILCHDCGAKTTTGFHFAFHKCQACGGYNTRVLSHSGGCRHSTDSAASAEVETPLETPLDTTGRVVSAESDEHEDDHARSETSRIDVEDHAEKSEWSSHCPEGGDDKKLGVAAAVGSSGRAVLLKSGGGDVSVIQEDAGVSSPIALRQTRKRRRVGKENI